MKRRLLLIGLLASVVAAITTTAVLVVAQQGNSEKAYSPPSQALQPDEVRALPSGRPVSSLTLPYEVGQLRILPVGSVPVPRGVPTPINGAKQVDVKKQELSGDACSKSSLAVSPEYVPSGWSTDGCYTESVVWDDGTTTDSMYVITYTRDGYYPITVGRAPRGDQQVDIVDEGQPFALTVTDFNGVPAVVRHQAPGRQANGPFSVTFVKDGIVTGVESAGIDTNELVQMASSIASTPGKSQ